MEASDFDQLPKPLPIFPDVRSAEIRDRINQTLEPFQPILLPPRTPLAIYITYMLLELTIAGILDSNSLKEHIQSEKDPFDEEAYNRALAFVFDLCETGGKNITRLNLKFD
ncbi:MAG: hypothetical protein NTX82_07595 [Candidatus Parcubacteria bacterium]|nr:hypothetical protein [Candidatus Parcubacteria bacterium]